MYLKSFKITNFRKFGFKNNYIDFVQSDYQKLTDVDSESEKSGSFVAGATTLVIGKNNSGKTTVTKALKHVVENEDITGNKFNLTYLKNIFDKYLTTLNRGGDLQDLPIPQMEFELFIGLDGDPTTYTVQNLSQFIPIKENTISELIAIKIKFLVKDSIEFKEYINKEFKNNKLCFQQFIKVIDNTKFIRQIYDRNDRTINQNYFNLKNLIDFKLIKANLDDGETTLSSVFNKIVQYRLRDEETPSRKKIEKAIQLINKFFNDKVGDSHNELVNSVVERVTDQKNMKVDLSSNLDFESIFKKLIQYQFEENNQYIPESQFGLGYSNLMKILGQIIDYVEQYESADSHHKVNLICIEEPENFMHPQMQELFIKNIDDALAVLLSATPDKNINSQLIITTHSSHIVNSKIHTSNTFDNINYITTDEQYYSHVVTLNDQIVRESPKEIKKSTNLKLEELNFLKKHIKYKVSELFFADAIILVEGITEEHLLQHYLSDSPEFKRHCISIFNINGAYAHIYKPLIELLKIPCLVITDLDIKRSELEKGKLKGSSPQQIFSTEGRETTNAVLKKFICEDQEAGNDDNDKGVLLPNNLEYYENEFFKIVFQKDSINGFIASSFEESFILNNYKDRILNAVLSELKPTIYKNIVGKSGSECFENSKDKSYEWQVKLSSSKSAFANTLLFKVIESDEGLPPLPQYIDDGLNWLISKLDGSISEVEES